MEPFTTYTDEIADGVVRVSTFGPEVSPDGFTFNQFLVRGSEGSLLFHTGLRVLFPLVSEAVAKVIDLERDLRWISFGHVEADESGAANLWLTAAPNAQVAYGQLGCDISLNDQLDRPPRALQEGEVIDLGSHRLRQISTPHVPHGWEAQVLFDEVHGTLFCGDLFSHTGAGPAITSDDLLDPAMAAEEMFHATALAPQTGATLRGLGDLAPSTLAVMHGSSYQGDGSKQLSALADAYDTMARAAAS
jgi:flavorubredoxin